MLFGNALLKRIRMYIKIKNILIYYLLLIEDLLKFELRYSQTQVIYIYIRINSVSDIYYSDIKHKYIDFYKQISPT